MKSNFLSVKEWNERKVGMPWDFFFNYARIEDGGFTYYQRNCKLDGLFEWICIKIEGFKAKLEGLNI